MAEGRNKVLEQIMKSGTVKKGQTVIVGFSGGPDSLTLLHGLNKLSHNKGLDLRLVPVHVNHLLRGRDAERDQERAVEMAESMGLQCLVFRRDCRGFAAENSMTEEEAGRKLRYDIFLETARRLEEEEGKRPVIAVAHNADDQSETIFFRIIRGTGIRGLAGMNAVRKLEDYQVVRPLLNVTRAEIEDYIESEGLQPSIDKTNMDDDYSRNRIRLRLIPEIESSMNQGFRENLRRLGENAREDEELLDSLAEKAFDEMRFPEEDSEFLRSVTVDSKKFASCHNALCSRITRSVFQELGIAEGFSRNIMEEVKDVASSDNPSARLELPGGASVRRIYGKLVFSRAEPLVPSGKETEGHDGSDGSVKIFSGTIYGIGEGVDREDKNGSSDGTRVMAVFDLDQLKKNYPGIEIDPEKADGCGSTGQGIVIRTRRPGDFIQTGVGRKKIQNMLVDMKIPKELRDSLKMAAVGGEILWILPDRRIKSGPLAGKGRFSQAYRTGKDDAGDKKVLAIEYRIQK